MLTQTASSPTVRPPFLRGEGPPSALRRESGAADPRAGLLEFFAGELRVLEFGRDGTSYRAVFGAGPGSAAGRLSPQERRVLGLLVHGRCQKEIAYDLGVAVTTVSSHVRAALDKLGLGCWEHAVLVTALLEGGRPLRESTVPRAEGHDGPAEALVEARGHFCAALLASLSSAERDVALMLVDGNTNAEIAARRRTSPRTVANQIASMFHKLRVQRRLEFIRRLTSPADDGSWQPLRSGATSE